jgi:putative nucleotidyltransferase with HDIG domain
MAVDRAFHRFSPQRRPYVPPRAARPDLEGCGLSFSGLGHDLQRAASFDDRLDRWAAALRDRVPSDRYQVMVQEIQSPLGKALLKAAGQYRSFDIFSSDLSHPVFHLRLEHAEPQIIRGENAFYPDLAAPVASGPCDQMLIPLWSSGQPLGLMVFVRTGGARYRQADLHTACDLVHLGITALENSLLIREIQIQNNLFNRMAPLTQALTHPYRESEITEAIGQGAMAISGADRVAVYGEDPKDRVLHVWSLGLSSASLGKILSAPREADPAQPSLAAQMILAPNVADLPDGSFFKQLASAEGIRALAVCPINVGQRRVASIDCYFNEPHEWSRTEKNVLGIYAQLAAIALHNSRQAEELEQTYTEAVLTLAKALDVRDAYTAHHSQRLAAWAENTARKFYCSPEDIQTIRWAALLHDIGKIGIPDSILMKAGPLTDEEWKVMKRHPELGAEIVAPLKGLEKVSPIIRAHQEKYDGSGYPDGLSGEAIPLPARILTVVDAFGAMTDNRVYRKARTKDEAIEELRRCAGRQFDRTVVDVFFEVIHSEAAL